MYKKDLKKLSSGDLWTIVNALDAMWLGLSNLSELEADLRSRRKGLSKGTQKEIKSMTRFYWTSHKNAIAILKDRNHMKDYSRSGDTWKKRRFDNDAVRMAPKEFDKKYDPKPKRRK
jgi:hypothetical protein